MPVVGQDCSADVAVLGTGCVGAVTAAGLAHLGHRVVCLDVSQRRVSALAGGRVPFHEPGLESLVREGLVTGRLSFTTDVQQGVRRAQVLLLCVEPPSRAADLADLCRVERAVREAVAHLPAGAVLAVRCPLPVGSGGWLRALLEHTRGDVGGSVGLACNPDFLRRGSAVRDFLHPDRVVVGGDEAGRGVVAALYAGVLSQSFPRGRRGVRPRLILTDFVSAELARHATSAFLAMKVSFANELAALCEATGADVRQLVAVLGADHRIGADAMEPGLGWGGPSLGADVAALCATAAEHGVDAALLRAAVAVNEAARGSVLPRLAGALGELRGCRIGVLGLAYRRDTDDLADSPALQVVRELLQAGCEVSAHDPVVQDLPGELSGVRLAADPYDAARGADAVVLATGWEAHVDLDLTDLAGVMHGRVVVDPRSWLDPRAARRAGLVLLQTGRPAPTWTGGPQAVGGGPPVA